MDIRLPTTTPKSTDSHAILLSAIDDANSYDQIGFYVYGGQVYLAWSYSTCSGTTINYYSSATFLWPGFVSGEIYTFRMYFTHGNVPSGDVNDNKVAFAVYDSKGTQVGITQYSVQNPNGVTPTSFLIQSQGVLCGNRAPHTFTNYIEQFVSSSVPDLTWTFENPRWLSGGAWAQTNRWQAYGAGGAESVPYGSWSTVSGLGNTMVQNWHDFQRYTGSQSGDYGWLLDKGSEGLGANGYGWLVGLYHGHTWIYEAKTQGSTSPPSYWREPRFAGGLGYSPDWYAYSSTNPSTMYVNSLGKWILAYTDARNNRVTTILSMTRTSITHPEPTDGIRAPSGS